MRHSILAFAFLAAALLLQAQDAKIYVVTHVDLTPNYIAEGTPLLQKYASDSLKDKGVVRFELLVQRDRKNHFTIVSVFANQAAFDAHVEANHTKQFREKLQPMLGSPLDERLHVLLQ